MRRVRTNDVNIKFVRQHNIYMKNLLLTFLLSIFSIAAFSQEWVELMQDPEVNFYDVQESFNTYWADKEYEKGKGYKQYKRWEYMMAPRVSPTGERPPAGLVYNEYLDFKAKYQRPVETSTNRSPNGDWSAIGPFGTLASGSPGVGRVNVIVSDPTDEDIVYLGTPGGGLWKSTTGGGNWQPMTDYMPTLGVSGIIVDAEDSQTIYIGTGDGDGDDTFGIGVLKSINGGQSFEPTGLIWEIQDFRVVNKLIASPYDHDVLYCATNEGLFKSTDAGGHWNIVLTGNVYDIEFHPTDNSKVYATKDRLFMSLDAGDSFNSVGNGSPPSVVVSRMLVAVTPAQPDYIYLLAANNGNGFYSVHRSTDGGDSFDERSDSPNLLGWSPSGNDEGGQAWYDLAFTVSPTDANRVMVGGVNVWSSTNGGITWGLRAFWVYDEDNPSNYVHADIHWLSYEGGRVWCGSDGGVFSSDNNGFSWTDQSQGLTNSQFYRLGGSATEAGTILAGAQDNGTVLLKNGIWRKVCGGDGMEAAVDPSNANRMYCASQFGNINRSQNGGNSFSNFSGGINQTGAWITPYVIDANNTGTIYAGYENLFRRIGSGSWQSISAGGSTITQVEVADDNSDVIFFARDASISRSLNGGDDWSFVNDGLPGAVKTGIDTRPGDATEVWVSCSGYGEGLKVYRSFDSGDTWEDMSLNLPGIPANDIVVSDDASGGVYVGMDVGVYYYNDNLANWVPFDEGMPKVIVSELEIQYSSGKLRAATYGRGLWESDLYTPTTAAPNADFEADRVIICEGNEIFFSDLSIEAAPGWEWTFEGGSPATSVEQEPGVVYTTAGEYAVSLSVSNDNGTTTETKTAYIKVLPAVGESFPYTEGFEGFDFETSDRWFREDINENGITWEVNPSVGDGSATSMWVDNYNAPFGYRDRLISNTIDLSGETEVAITFKVANAKRFPGNNDRIRVYTSANCGEDWILRETYNTINDFETGEMSNEPFIPSSDQWVELLMNDIPDSDHVEGFRMMFELENGGGNNIYLDNINLSVISSVADIDLNRLEMEIFPNPATEEFQLNFNLIENRTVGMSIIDMTGRTVMSDLYGELSQGTQRITVKTADMAQGVYHLQLSVDGQIVSRKLVID